MFGREHGRNCKHLGNLRQGVKLSFKKYRKFDLHLAQISSAFLFLRLTDPQVLPDWFIVENLLITVSLPHLNWEFPLSFSWTHKVRHACVALCSSNSREKLHDTHSEHGERRLETGCRFPNVEPGLSNLVTKKMEYFRSSGYTTISRFQNQFNISPVAKHEVPRRSWRRKKYSGIGIRQGQTG